MFLLSRINSYIGTGKVDESLRIEKLEDLDDLEDQPHTMMENNHAAKNHSDLSHSTKIASILLYGPERSKLNVDSPPFYGGSINKEQPLNTQEKLEDFEKKINEEQSELADIQEKLAFQT